MSEGPISRERLATTATPIPKFRAGDHVICALDSDPIGYVVIATDGVIATLAPRAVPERRVRRYHRDLIRTSRPEPHSNQEGEPESWQK